MFRIATGVLITLGGLWLVVVGLSEGLGAMVPGLVITAIGVAILFNKQEDEIEEIKNDKYEDHE